MMLELSAVDLDALAEALQDHTDFIRWFIDPLTGEIVPWSEDMDEPCPEDAGAHYIDPVPSSEAYEDMRDFVAGVPERRAANLLARAIEGRGAFRRFKDALFEFPELREGWFRFHDVRMRRRGVGWLEGAGLVDAGAAEIALRELADPPVGDGVVDPFEVAATISDELRVLFAGRLVDVVVFGSYAQGNANQDSDLDIAVVLRDVHDGWEEGRHMDEILWRHTLQSGIAVSAFVVDAADWDAATRPIVRTARASGRSVS